MHTNAPRMAYAISERRKDACQIPRDYYLSNAQLPMLSELPSGDRRMQPVPHCQASSHALPIPAAAFRTSVHPLQQPSAAPTAIIAMSSISNCDHPH